MSDLIKREDVVKEFGRVFDDLGLTLFGVGGNDLAQVIANAIPFAERKGEWIEHRPPTNDYCGMVECPFCGEELVGEPTDFNYCPNCGARMKGADDERYMRKLSDI